MVGRRVRRVVGIGLLYSLPFRPTTDARQIFSHNLKGSAHSCKLDAKFLDSVFEMCDFTV